MEGEGGMEREGWSEGDKEREGERYRGKGRERNGRDI
jgi:hypothetical protein